MYWYNLIKAKNRFKKPKEASRVELLDFETTTFSSDGLTDIRPSSTGAKAPVFPHNQCMIVGFTNLLFPRKFIHCIMLPPFIIIITFLSSSILFTKGEKFDKEVANKVR